MSKCFVMKYSLKIIIATLLVLSCSKAEKKLNPEPVPILLKMGYYPTFYVPAETILNLNEKYILFYSPTKYIHEPPPPSDLVHNLSIEQQKENYQRYLQETPELKPFKAGLSETDIWRIESVLKSFTTADFVDKEGIAGVDGMRLNFVILYSNVYDLAALRTKIKYIKKHYKRILLNLLNSEYFRKLTLRETYLIP